MRVVSRGSYFSKEVFFRSGDWGGSVQVRIDCLKNGSLHLKQEDVARVGGRLWFWSAT